MTEEERTKRRAASTAYYHRNKEAVKADKKRAYDANPQKHRDRRIAWARANPVKQLRLSCIKSARERGQECELTLEQLQALVAPMRCAVTGVELSWAETPRGPWLPSVDRLDNSRGYVLDNVRIVCWAYNSMRGEWDDEVVLAMAEALVTACKSAP